MTKIIEDQKNHLVSFNPNIQLPEISMAVMLRESSYEKLEKLLTSSANVVLENLSLEEGGQEVTNMEQIMEKENIWLCISCNKNMNNEQIKCEACQVFKPLEMYKNILHNPKNVTDEEISQLNERRKQEKQLILERDMEKVED